MPVSDGWSSLFASAFAHSRNAMLLVDDGRRVVSANDACIRLLGRARRHVIGERVWTFVAGGPLNSEAEWMALMAKGRFTGEVDLQRPDGTVVAVQWGRARRWSRVGGWCCSWHSARHAGDAGSAAR